MNATAFPLSWPEGFPRSAKREKSRFSTTLPAALKNVNKSLELFAKESGKAVSGIVLSSNVSLGNDRPDDPGIAVWFTWDGLSICIPCDRYQKAEENLQAIHHVIEARRTEMRHGTLHMVRATMRGFLALPAPSGLAKRDWRAVLDFPADARPTATHIEAQFKMLAKKLHPDRGGSVEAMAELNRAREEALRA